MRLRALLSVIALLLALGSMPAAARPHDGSMWTASEVGSLTAPRGERQRSAHTGRRHGSGYARNYTRQYSGVGPRPAKWCGWWMRTQKGGGPEYNLAANWRRYGSPASPQIGAVVVWSHHVGMITGRAANGQWIVTSGNDGGAVRSRARSIAGATIRI